MKCNYCLTLIVGKTYRVDGDGFCVVCHEKTYSDGVNVVYTGILRGFHRFRAEGMSICGSCGVDLSEMTLPCFESHPVVYQTKKLTEVVQGE